MHLRPVVTHLTGHGRTKLKQESVRFDKRVRRSRVNSKHETYYHIIPRWLTPQQLTVFLGTVPESVWAKGSSNSGGLSSHLVITSSHLQIFSSSSSHLLIFTSLHLLHIFTFSYLHIFFTSSHLHIFTFSYLHIFFTSSSIFWSSHLHILPSCLSFFSISLLRRVAVPTRLHEMPPFRTKWGSIVKNWGKIASLKRPAQPFRTKWGLIVKNCGKIAISKYFVHAL